jgi:hypothetical protein
MVIEFPNRTNQLLAISAYCDICRQVLAPSGLSGNVSTEDVAQEKLYRRTRTAITSAVTRRTNAAAAVPWADLSLYIEPPRVRGHQLYTLWNGTNIATREVATHLRKSLGLENERHSRVITTAIGDVTLDERLVQHPLVPVRRAERYNADHLRFWPLAITTVTAPDEIDEMPARPRMPQTPPRAPSYYFLKLYWLNNRLITHLVVVDRRDHFAITMYRYDDADPKRLDRDRAMGIALYSRLIL